MFLILFLTYPSFFSFQRELEDVDWDEIQENELLDELEDELGSVKNWTDDDIENAFELLPELDDDFDDDNDNETVSKIWKAINSTSKQAKWKLKQVSGFLSKTQEVPSNFEGANNSITVLKTFCQLQSDHVFLRKKNYYISFL